MDIRVTAEDARDVLRRLASAQADFLRQHAEAVAAHLAHAKLKADARPQGRLFQQQHKGCGRSVPVAVRPPLMAVGGTQNVANLIGSEVRYGQEMAARRRLNKSHGLLILLLSYQKATYMA